MLEGSKFFQNSLSFFVCLCFLLAIIVGVSGIWLCFGMVFIILILYVSGLKFSYYVVFLSLHSVLKSFCKAI